MYRFLLTRQWVGLTLICLLLMPAMVRLGFWQLHRHETRVAHNQQIADSLDASTVPVERLTSPGHEVPGSDRYRPVAATGTYDSEHEVVVRQRTGSDDQIGYHVLTPLVQPNGKAVLVNRGWITPGENLTSFPDIPPAPRGEVTVTGLLLPEETTASSGIKDRPGLPDRQVMLINGARLDLDRPLLGGYLQLSTTSPRPTGVQPEPLGEPDHGSIGPHLAYSWNWWLLAAGVPLGWVILLRRELRDQAAAAGQGPAGTGSVDAGKPETPQGDPSGARGEPAEDTPSDEIPPNEAQLPGAASPSPTSTRV